MKKYITAPEVTLPNGTVVPSFRVGQFACGKGEDGKTIITAEAKPWVEINYHEAREACAEIGGALITELQWLAIAHDVANQDCNWTGGKVGVGNVYQGIHKGNVSNAQSGNYESSDPDERSWHQLSNGERIYHFAGNCFSWVFDDVQGDMDGITTIIKQDSPSLITAPYPSMQKGVGWMPSAPANWSGYALIRGGRSSSGSGAGVFYLNYGWPDYRFGGIGFRCTTNGL